MGELICPNSGEPCESAGFCGWKQQSQERGAETAGDRLAAWAGAEIREAWQSAGFCAQNRIDALGEVANRSGVSMETSSEARRLAGGVEIARTDHPAYHAYE